MSSSGLIPPEPLDFIKACVVARRVYWTYHVNMRLQLRSISRESILGWIANAEIIEENPRDKYLPSYLLRLGLGEDCLHVLVAVDVKGDNVRMVTAYRPDAGEWSDDFRTRRTEP